MTAEDKTRVTVTIYGTKYTLMGQASKSTMYLQMVAAQVDEQMRKIATNAPHLDMPRIAVLTAVNMADDLGRLQESYDRMQRELEESQKQREAMQQQLQELRADYKALQQDQQEQHEQLDARSENVDAELRVEYEKLKDEYRKLQSEYNEWIQLIERDDS